MAEFLDHQLREKAHPGQLSDSLVPMIEPPQNMYDLSPKCTKARNQLIKGALAPSWWTARVRKRENSTWKCRTSFTFHRYPVKSMMGEELNATEVADEFGLLGDRAYAMVDSSDGKVASAKNPRKWPDLFNFQAKFMKNTRIWYQSSARPHHPT